MAVEINLIPNSGLQFWTVTMDLASIGRTRRSFWEERSGEYEDGTPRYVLHDVIDEESDTGKDEGVKQRPADVEDYQVGRKQVVEMFREQWVPLPYFVARRARTGETYGRGPANWARGRLVERDGGELLLTLAFDTALESKTDELYNAPTPEDSQRQEQFVLAHRAVDVAWFLNEGWIGDWLSQMLEERRLAERGGRRPLADLHERSCEHYAIYQTFLTMLAESGAMPRVQVLHEASETSVDVDLVLDLGNARSCGILIEEHPGQAMDFADSYKLRLRDLSRPELEYDDPFPSRVEFAQASFGRDRLSKRSQRGNAFSWPNPARTGYEAVRLAGSRVGNEGLTGLSSPKRYLWDTRPSVQGWRFNGRSADGQVADPPVNGPFRTMLAELPPYDRKGAAEVTLVGPAVFSRSMLTTFMLVEVILQAMMQMNGPRTRLERRDVTRPRRLRAVMLTMPPGMPVAEQRIFRHRAKTAIALAWRMLGRAPATAPQLRAELDEATATQIVWLHNEVTERLGGNVSAFFELYGRERVGDTGRSLRLASIDIGGGTTDLMITTYMPSAGGALRPQQLFRESFKTAGDDVLACVIVRLVLPPIEAALGKAGAGDPKAVLSRALAQDHAGQSEQDRHLRRLFVSGVLEAAALALLRPYENLMGREGGELARFTFADVVRGGDQAVRSTAYLARQAAAAGARDFDLLSVELVCDAGAIEQVIGHTLGQVLADLGEVVWNYDCDVLLLSGRPSRLRRVADMVMATMPVAPHRIVSMYRYRVGSQYAFRDALDRIDDPKTTVVVGAALCVQAEGRLQDFTLRTRELRMRSTARIVGRMDLSDEMREENVLLRNVDLDGPPTEDVSFVVRHFEGKTRIGFRQLGVARWPATPLYMLEFNSATDLSRVPLPLQVTIRRVDIETEREEKTNDFAGREDFRVSEVVDAEDNPRSTSIVDLRLQTLRDADGYWRDTGRLALN